ncbi:prostaglandin E synthase 2 [Chrysoperla carnea]|uniref:prostaglandin E synthase 2 n=1 Tax=Chrysoperla carnea TaxID=189513 RepID=UPI001D071F3D|nr:prostaglandin E synthase 2 [Chrysoperla carnea]
MISLKSIYNFATATALFKQMTRNNVKFKPIMRLMSTEKKVKQSGGLKIGLIGITAGAIGGTGYSIYKLNEARGHIINETMLHPILKDMPKIEPSRRVKYPNDTSGLKLTLFQYQTCPFCCKVRAFLDYHGISYDVVEVDPVLRQSIRWSEYKKVPILVASYDKGYQQINDSSMIISALSSFLIDNQQTLSQVINFYPSVSFIDDDGTKKVEIMNRYFLMFQGTVPANRTPEDMAEERKWRKWADTKLVHSLSPNVYRTPTEALQAFTWFSDVGEWERLFPAWERALIVYVGAFAMWIIGKRLKSRHNLKDDVRISLYEDCDFWVRSLKKKGTTFMGGSEPNLADLAVFGVLNSIEGCDAFQDVLRNTKIKNWYNKMREKVTSHQSHTLNNA